MIRRLMQRMFGGNSKKDVSDIAIPFEVTLASYNDKWVIVRDDDPMGMAVTREGAIDLALRLSRSIVADHLDSSVFVLHGATREEVVAGVQRLEAWLARRSR